jgi:ABC-type glycerol-3-phosphate transport system permease component
VKVLSEEVNMVKDQRTVGNIIFAVINYLLLFLFFLMCTYPFYYILINSISDAVAAARGWGVFLWPVKPTLKNYAEVFKIKGIALAALISVLRTVIGTVITVACCSFFGYLVTKPMYGRKFIYRFVVATMYFSAGLIPYYLTMRAYGLFNSFLVYVVPGALSAFNIILFKTFIEQIPASMEESALIEGAGYIRIFHSIIFPLSLPIVATITVFCAVGQWNAWFDNYIYISNPNLATLQLKLYELLQAADTLADQANRAVATDMATAARTITPMAVRMTLTMVVTLPIILVYPFMQRFFVKGIMMGAIKG